MFIHLILATAVAFMPADAAESKKAIRQILDSQVAAWNKGDLKGFMTTYWNSPDLVFFSGKDVTKGWQATYGRFQKRYHIAAAFDRNLWLTGERIQPDYAGRPWTLWTANTRLVTDASTEALRWVVVQP